MNHLKGLLIFDQLQAAIFHIKRQLNGDFHDCAHHALKRHLRRRPRSSSRRWCRTSHVPIGYLNSRISCFFLMNIYITCNEWMLTFRSYVFLIHEDLIVEISRDQLSEVMTMANSEAIGLISGSS